MAQVLFPYSSLDENHQVELVRRYHIREKLYSFRNCFEIKDETDQLVFIVRSKVLAIGNKLVLQDMSGESLIKIQEELLHFRRTYRLSSVCKKDSDDSLAVLKRTYSATEPMCDIDTVYGEYLLETTDIGACSFTLTKNGDTVATINKNFHSKTNSYDVEITNNEDQAFILALIIAINQILDDGDF